MPVASVPCALLGPRLAALARHLPQALDGRVTSVHQARVASRRLREVLPVVGLAAGPRRLRRALRRVKRVTRAFGPVRELDVTLELLDEIAGGHPDLRFPTRLVRRLVVHERDRRRVTMLDALDRDEVQRTCDAVRSVLERLMTVRDDGGWRGVLARRAMDRAGVLIDSIADVSLLFDPARLHQVRIAVKKLRYALELSGDARLLPARRLVATLKGAQAGLGRLHDLQVLLVFARAPEIDTVARYRKPLAALRDVVERECRREHARYVRRRPRLLHVCDATMDALRDPSRT
jgi:CHAD domain-containing protein